MNNTEAITTIPGDRLREVLEQQRIWSLSGGKEGEPAKLAGADLSQQDLRDCNLEQADLSGADLTEVKMIGAKLKGAKFGDADVTGASFRDADLTGSDLSKVKGLLPAQLGGANLTRAKLPQDISGFEGTAQATNISRLARFVFLTMLATCVFSWLTIAITEDVELLTDSTDKILPIVGIPVPIVAFHWVAPAILLVLYIYFHLYVQGFWEELSQLPARFPDGRAIDEHIEPWLVASRVHAYVPVLQTDRPHLSWIRETASVLVGWWLVPVTLGRFWLRPLPLHDWIITSWHVLLLILAILFGVATFRGGKATLQGVPWPGALRAIGQFRRDYRTVLGCLLIVAVSVGALKRPRIDDVPAPWVTENPVFLSLYGPFKWIDDRRFLDLVGAKVTAMPPNWGDIVDPKKSKYLAELGRQLKLVVDRSDLTNKNLEHARAQNAFLAKALLDGANFDGASLDKADLRGAELNSASLRDANLRKTKLDLAKLSSAHLEGARLVRASLRGAELSNAHLTDAVLVRAVLVKAQLTNADLSGANLIGASLSGANLSGANLSGAKLIGANLSGANLSGANLSGANLKGANLTDADLRDALGLTKAQLARACSEGKHRLPTDLSKVGLSFRLCPRVKP